MKLFKLTIIRTLAGVLLSCLILSCGNSNGPVGAGFRYSEYGPKYNPGKDYWKYVGEEMASKFKNSNPECIWIVGCLNKRGVKFNFPVDNKDSLITGSETDENKEIFKMFDKIGMKVWLQIEPGYASIEEQIKIVLDKYKDYKCVIGFGIDVEWNKSKSADEGLAISDEDAKKWLSIIKSYNPEYKMFLKHWLIEKMPPTIRKDIVFVSDSQQFKSLDEMLAEFKEWGKAFEPSKVGFQYGYPADKIWWGEFKDPAQKIGQTFIKNIPNTSSLFWVDFTVIDVFPPKEDVL